MADNPSRRAMMGYVPAARSCRAGDLVWASPHFEAPLSHRAMRRAEMRWWLTWKIFCLSSNGAGQSEKRLNRQRRALGGGRIATGENDGNGWVDTSLRDIQRVMDKIAELDILLDDYDKKRPDPH
jgi:hypothetical protein